MGNDQTVAIRQRAALEPLFYAGGTENHVDAVFYGAHTPRVRGVMQRRFSSYCKVCIHGFILALS